MNFDTQFFLCDKNNLLVTGRCGLRSPPLFRWILILWGLLRLRDENVGLEHASIFFDMILEKEECSADSSHPIVMFLHCLTIIYRERLSIITR